jgi:hypothetical protein
MTTDTVTCDPGATLSKLNSIVVQQENRFRILTRIGNNGSETTFEFLVGKKPTNHSVIGKNNQGIATIPGGASLICSGLIFIEGNLTLCSVTRLP